jgi:hypothetical protein
LTHRPADYHPDHRYTGQLVQDAAYMVTVPRIASDTPPLTTNPIFGYLSDRFQKPAPLDPQVIVGIDEVIDEIADALDAHESQFYEWLPHNMGILGQVPTDPAERKRQLRDWFFGHYCLKSSDLPTGKAPANAKYVEAFEISEYGSLLTPDARRQLFPFLA